MDFFNELSSMEQAYWVVASIGTISLLVVLISTFIGGVDSNIDVPTDEFDIDDGGLGFQFFTFKNFVAFLFMMGWSGIVLLDAGFSNLATILWSFFAGLIMMGLTSLLFYFVQKLSQSGTLNINNAIGAIGNVYLPIGAERSSVGKIQITVQGSLRELDAVTDEENNLKTTQMIQVTQVLDPNLLLVEKLKTPK